VGGQHHTDADRPFHEHLIPGWIADGPSQEVSYYGIDIALSSMVTAPFRAKALPDSLAPVAKLTLVSARMFPLKAVPVPSVAELPTCQYTLRARLPPVMTTDELLAVLRALAILKMNTDLALPVSVSVPVN
jgi:hypothetical protein